MSLSVEDLNFLITLIQRDINTLQGFVSLGNEVERYNKYCNVLLHLEKELKCH